MIRSSGSVLCYLCPALFVVSVCGVAARAADEPQHVDIYKIPGRFGGWPANHGAWIWDNEILVGFAAGFFKDNGPERHAIDHDRPEEHLFARSKDGGQTWAIEDASGRGGPIPWGKSLHGIQPPGLTERPYVDCPGGIDFTHPDFCMTLRMTDIDQGPSRFHYSIDRGHNWKGPFKVPMFDQPGIMARTDYIVNAKDDCILILTASKQDHQEGRCICVRTTDGGKTWKFQSFIGPEPKGFSIMPSTVRVGKNELLTALRVHEEKKRWIDLWRSTDDGLHWEAAGRPVPDTGEGNPAAMHVLKDGRVCMTYGDRKPPFRMCARLSKDGGRTWGDELTIRSNGGCRDIGYPRSVQRPDGKVVTMYYFNDAPLGDRYLAATIWDPK
jgi:hypothetical protein